MRESSLQPQGVTAGTLSSVARRSASADPGVDVFRFPDSTDFVLPSAWGVKRYIKDNPKRFRTCSFCSLQQEALAHRDVELFVVPRGFDVAELPLKSIERPERCQPTREGWFVDRPRLFSVLEAMVSGEPLPPIQVSMTRGGSWRIENGFHRYFASLVLEYTEIPALRESHDRSSGRPVGDRLGLAGRKARCPILLQGVVDDGRRNSLQATVAAPKEDGAARPDERQREPLSACRPRYEPPAVRRARLLQEEQDRRRRELEQLATQFKRRALSREAIDRDQCQQMRRPSISYAEKALGRLKPAEPPSWDQEPSLPR